MRVTIYEKNDMTRILKEFEEVEHVQTISLSDGTTYYLIEIRVVEPYFFKQEYEFRNNEVDISIW